MIGHYFPLGHSCTNAIRGHCCSLDHSSTDTIHSHCCSFHHFCTMIRNNLRNNVFNFPPTYRLPTSEEKTQRCSSLPSHFSFPSYLYHRHQFDLKFELSHSKKCSIITTLTFRFCNVMSIYNGTLDNVMTKLRFSFAYLQCRNLLFLHLIATLHVLRPIFP